MQSLTLRDRLWLAGQLWSVDRRIRRRGWTAIYLGDYESRLTWVYTLGFEETLGHPELVIFDLPRHHANSVLWEIYQDLAADRLTIADGDRWPADEPKCMWRTVDPSRISSGEGWFSLARQRRLARDRDPDKLQVMQLVLPDQEGRLPWEDDYDESIRLRQPALYSPRLGDPPPAPARAPDRVQAGP